MIRFKTENTMEFENMEQFEQVLSLMPWTPEQKEEFLKTGEFQEEDEAEFDFGAVDSTHKFTFEEV